jgi:Signal transduction histidine kinase
MVPQRAARRRLDALTARETVGGVAGVSSTEEDARWSVRRIGVLAGSVALVALVIVGQVVNAGNTAGILTGESAVIAVAFLTMGAMVLVRMPRHLVGRLMLAAGGAASISVLSTSWTTWVVVDWVSQWSWWPAYGLITLALLYFPDGRLPSPRWRSLAVFIVAGTAAAAAAFAVAALDDPRDLINTDNPGVAATGRAQLLVQVGMLAVVATLAGLVAVLVSLFLRWRRADGEARAQLACLLAAGVLLVLGVVLEAMNLTGAWVIMVVALPVGMGLAILRYRLYGLDQVINRTLVWLVMSLLVIAGFVGLITLLRDLLMADDTSNASLVATGLIAVTFEPIRGRVQRGVNRLLYGDRDDPYQVITRLGDLLGRTVEPTAVLPLLTGTIARSLRVPQVAVEVEGREGPRLVAVHGASNNPVESFEMVARGQHVGRLLVANRSATSRFSPVERRLLKDLALQAAVAADAVRLIHDLQDSRERLITAREEERRRLRRELHDGLGPTLAGMAMQVRAAQKLAAEQPRLTRILDALAADLQTCTAEVRQLVSQLRPPALDRGLAAALRHECARFDTATLSVRLEIDGDLQGLPAAIEVAAYRIVAEALTNVTRHARASTCRVLVRRDRALTLEIVDDGVGLGPRRPGGVGLDSMRERATELGGDFEIGPVDPHGTAVRVRLPFQPMRAKEPADGSGGRTGPEREAEPGRAAEPAARDAADVPPHPEPTDTAADSRAHAADTDPVADRRVEDASVAAAASHHTDVPTRQADAASRQAAAGSGLPHPRPHGDPSAGDGLVDGVGVRTPDGASDLIG